MAGVSEEGDYAGQAAAFVAAAERYAALGLPGLPDDPAAAAAMRAAGYEVLAEVLEAGDVAIVRVLSEDEYLRHVVKVSELTAALGAQADQLAGREFIATMRETQAFGVVLSGFRPAPAPEPEAAGTEMTVRCLLLFGDQAELAAEGGEEGDVARWPAAAITADTGLPLEDLPGRRFRARVTEQDGRVLFSGFSLPG